MLVEVDVGGDVPLFEQIAAQVRAGIGRGDPAPGERLPTARELAEALGVNMHTVLRAYGQLRDEGLLEVRRRRGVTVRSGGDTRARLVELVRALRAEATRQGLGLPDLHRLIDETP
jgi:GntR family transcriptional regulator